MKVIKILTMLVFIVISNEFELFCNDSIALLNKNIGIMKLKNNAYLMKSSFALNGNLDCNHLLIIDKTGVLLVNTPVNDSITKIMFACIEQKFKKKVTKVIASHFHEDSSGGLLEAKKQGATTYGLNLTQEKLKNKGIKFDIIFTDSLKIMLSSESTIELYYFGAGHSVDNIVVWLPNEKILFGGCLLKSLSTNSRGNINDADLVQWPLTVMKVKERFNAATIVIPGHADIGDNKIFDHTIKIFSTN